MPSVELHSSTKVCFCGEVHTVIRLCGKMRCKSSPTDLLFQESLNHGHISAGWFIVEGFCHSWIQPIACASHDLAKEANLGSVKLVFRSVEGDTCLLNTAEGCV